ncbi:hypothetical protein D9V32_05500 [Mycetocola tolaasinivorans]|uniref:Capsid maturation protease n=1 Tax=Mycetocola tolaasinivorans TaxID=76635 RepID=A0A3L7A8A1_9MICO|nr:hypothetical protein [Mycetocola tolaasinivorans]RLP76325.1 hypothetical protein D9V32_05500 [Mycetocola tolaasinivorans]
MGDDFDLSYAALSGELTDVVREGMAAVVTTTIDYTPSLLSAMSLEAPPVGNINPVAFLDQAPNGMSVERSLSGATRVAKTAIGRGASTRVALGQAQVWLTGVILTMLADTGRGVMGADITQRPSLAGYVRVVNGSACRDCMILAARFYRWNSGFLRHPRCHCRHVPAPSREYAEEAGLITDPYEGFNSLSTTEQNRVFGETEAQAIRDGADIYRVVNISNRGLGTAASHAKYGTPHRLTLDQIYERTAAHGAAAGRSAEQIRAAAIRIMGDQGYITGAQTVGGNILGGRAGYGALGKGGKARAAADSVTAAQRTGTRDPLNRYTMTAAERRLFDAKTRVDMARAGYRPRSIGQNTADKYTPLSPITPSALATYERALAAELAKLPNQAASVRDLARLLGL